MPATLKRNAVVVFGLAVLFYWAFMFAKHDPALRGIIPFGDDPYDAVGSFGVIVGLLVAALSLVRAFRPRGRRPPSEADRVYLIRTQAAVALMVPVTVAADAIAMARHPSMWVGAPSAGELLALVGGLAAAGAAVLWLVLASRGERGGGPSGSLARAAFVALLGGTVLAVYPERLIRGLATHLLTVLVGDLVLFATIRPFLTALIGLDEREPATGMARARGGRRWAAVVGSGALVGAVVFAGEMSEGVGAQPAARLALVAVVFVGLAIAGLLIAYVCLGEPLGLAPRAGRFRL